MTKKLVQHCESRFAALEKAVEDLDTTRAKVEPKAKSAASTLTSYSSELSDQGKGLSRNYEEVTTALRRHETFLKSNQMEIDALEARLRTLRADRAKAIADAAAADHGSKKTVLESALELNKLSKTACEASHTLITTSMDKTMSKWVARTEHARKSKDECEADRLDFLQSLVAVLALWVHKKESKLGLMQNLVSNAKQAENEGLQVTFDVASTEQDMSNLEKSLEAEKLIMDQMEARLAELGGGRREAPDTPTAVMSDNASSVSAGGSTLPPVEFVTPSVSPHCPRHLSRLALSLPQTNGPTRPHLGLICV